MGSSMDSARWTCPHCFSVIEWSNPKAVENHECEEIRRLIARVRAGNKTAKLDAAIAVLKNPKRKEKKHG